MHQRPDHHQHVRRVVLPSGKTIEVVYFENEATGQSPRPVGPARELQPESPDLHVCGTCSSELVYPVEWEEAGATHWEVVLRCPNCEWNDLGVFDQGTVDRFDDELDRGTETLLRDLQRLSQANMEDEIERFINALEGDHVLPEDF